MFGMGEINIVESFKIWLHKYRLLLWLFVVAISIDIVWGFSETGSLIKNPIPIAGVSIYVIIYIMAQLDERIVEIVSDVRGFFHKDKTANKYERTIELWCLASIIGIFLCYYTAGLFQIIGISFTIHNHSLDSILSGLIIGGGTKPLHDFISYIDKSGDKKG